MQITDICLALVTFRQPWLNVRITWGVFKIPDGQTILQANCIRTMCQATAHPHPTGDLFSGETELQSVHTHYQAGQKVWLWIRPRAGRLGEVCSLDRGPPSPLLSTFHLSRHHQSGLQFSNRRLEDPFLKKSTGSKNSNLPIMMF